MSVLKPYGVWVVISPFNFPMALSGAPICAALITGNTVVFKGASSTLYTGWKTAELFAGSPACPWASSCIAPRAHHRPGLRTIPTSPLGLSPAPPGRWYAGGTQRAQWPLSQPGDHRNGRQNPTIVSRHADLDKAATGVARSAFGLDGQKCSACSRVYVEEKVYDQFVALLVEKSATLKVGNPTMHASGFYGHSHRQRV